METPRRVLGGRYELAGKHGEGGMGQVFRGRDLLKNREVAVKLLAEELTADPVVRDRFRREADVLRELNHPTLVKLFDTQLEGREPFLVFEYVEGERLDGVIGGRPMDVQRALALMAQLASALAALHGRSVVHRDVKPQNLMLRGDGTLVLLDFGTAKRFGSEERTAEQLTTEGFVIGTLQYMPPEALFKDAPLAPTYDVWSCGVVLWEMLVGSRPFIDVETRGMTAFMDALRQCQVPALTGLLPDVPAPVAQLVRAMMERDPRARIQDGAALGRAIDQAQSALEDEGPGETRRLSRKLQRMDTPRNGPPIISQQRASGGTLVLKRPVEERAGGRAVAMGGLIAILIASLAGYYLMNQPAVAPVGDPTAMVAAGHAEAVSRIAGLVHRNPIGLVNALVAAAGTVTADAADGGHAAFVQTLVAQGVSEQAQKALESARFYMTGADGAAPATAPLVRALLALEFVDQFSSAVEWPRAFRLGVSDVLPKGYLQRAQVVAETDLKKLSLAADGRGASAALRFTVADPERVTALWVALSGEELRRGHVVLVKINDSVFSMGGADPGHQSGGQPVELIRALPASMLKAGDNRLDARVLGAPDGSSHDPEGLKVALRVRTS